MYYMCKCILYRCKCMIYILCITYNLTVYIESLRSLALHLATSPPRPVRSPAGFVGSTGGAYSSGCRSQNHCHHCSCSHWQNRLRSGSLELDSLNFLDLVQVWVCLVFLWTVCNSNSMCVCAAILCLCSDFRRDLVSLCPADLKRCTWVVSLWQAPWPVKLCLERSVDCAPINF